MASVLKVDTLTGVTTAGSIAVTGEGNSTTTNLQQGLAKQWVNFDGTGTVSVRDSLNTTSITDRGTGGYDPNFTSNFSAATYNVTTGPKTGHLIVNNHAAIETGKYYLSHGDFTYSVNSDQSYVNGTAHGDLA